MASDEETAKEVVSLLREVVSELSAINTMLSEVLPAARKAAVLVNGTPAERIRAALGRGR